MNYFIINEAGTVVDAILWDGDTVNNPIRLAEGWQSVQSDVGGIGWTYVEGEFIPPPQEV